MQSFQAGLPHSSIHSSLGIFLLLLAFVTRLTLAAAPLLHRDVANAIPNNYIFVLNSSSTQSVQKALSVLHLSPDQLPGGFGGLRRVYENLGGLTAFHIECDSGTLNTLLRAPSVSSPSITVLHQFVLTISRSATRSLMAESKFREQQLPLLNHRPEAT
jgi:hypothetical protein